MDENVQTRPASKIRAWSVVLGIIAIAILAIIVFCHVAYWLMWIGAITVIVLLVIVAANIAKGARKIKRDFSGN